MTKHSDRKSKGYQDTIREIRRMAGSLGTRGTGHTNGTTRNTIVPAHNMMDQEGGTRTTQPEMVETSGKFSSL
jgi:hypothetical protein